MKNITWNVEGMMCAHCENRVKTALSEIDGVAQCEASAKNKQVTVSFDEQKVQVDKLKETIEDVGYQVM